ncbi:alanine racemase [Anoxybacter fermentans]|nr:alanine racemase [Anoxybacter fermentans]
MKKPLRPVWAEINLDNYTHNIKVIKKRYPETKIMAVVKADGYGHGAIQVAKAALLGGAERLAVAIVDEGIELREAGFKVPIQILGGTAEYQLEQVVDYDLIQTVFDLETARSLSRIAQKKGKEVKVHLKIDTGMGRIGVQPEEAGEMAAAILALPNLKLEGLMTHFATADEKDKSYTLEQLERYLKALKDIESRGIKIDIKHVANSATIIDLPELRFDMIRPGIMAYGLWPSDDVDHTIDIRPVMEWKARIIYVKEVPAGTGISYGKTFVTKRKTRVATLPLGYADGYSRHLSNKGQVLVKGKRAPVIGRVCMDQTMIDVTDIEGVQVGDEVVLLGRQGNDFISAEEMASWIGTINYEVVCAVSKRVPRYYIGQAVE